MLAALIGWKVAGIAGAAVATAAFYLPPALLVYGVARLWGRWRGNPWHQAIERGGVMGMGLLSGRGRGTTGTA